LWSASETNLSLGLFSPSSKGNGTNLSLGPVSSLNGAGTTLSVVPFSTV